MVFFLTLCEFGALLLLMFWGASFSVLEQFPHIHEWVNMQLYTQSCLQHISGAFSVCGSLLSNTVLWTLPTLLSLGIPTLDSQLCLLYSGSLMSSASVLPPYTMAWKLSPSNHLGLLPGLHNWFLVSQEFTLLHCLRSNVLRNIVLYNLSTLPHQETSNASS